MRNAPSVLIPVGRSRFGPGVLAAAWLAGLALGVAWWLQAPAAGTWPGLSNAQTVMAALLALCGGWAWHSHRRACPGWLDWDGHSWCWITARGDYPVRVEVAGDWQRLLLVRVQPQEGPGSGFDAEPGVGPEVQWLWLTPRGSPAHWRAIRRALYFRASRQAPPDGTAPMP